MKEQESGRLTRAQVEQLLGVDDAFLMQLEAESIICCDENGCYEESSIERVRICRTLRSDLGVNLPGVEVILNLLDIIEGERAQFMQVLAHLRKRFAEELPRPPTSTSTQGL